MMKCYEVMQYLILLNLHTITREVTHYYDCNAVVLLTSTIVYHLIYGIFIYMLSVRSYMYTFRQQVPIHYIYVHIQTRLFVHTFR